MECDRKAFIGYLYRFNRSRNHHAAFLPQLFRPNLTFSSLRSLLVFALFSFPVSSLSMRPSLTVRNLRFPQKPSFSLRELFF